MLFAIISSKVSCVFVNEVCCENEMQPVRRQKIGCRTRNVSRIHNFRDNETEEEGRQRFFIKKMCCIHAVEILDVCNFIEFFYISVFLN